MGDVFGSAFRFPIVFGALAIVLAADPSRRGAPTSRLAPAGGPRDGAPASPARRLAYYGALSVAFLLFAALAAARLGRF